MEPQADFFAGTINLVAVGIGGINAVSIFPGRGATLTTTGANGTGDIRLTSPAGLGAFTFDTDTGSAQNITIEKSAALAVTTNLMRCRGGRYLTLHAGSSGIGNLTFSGTPTITADSIVLWAGSGNGTDTTAKVDLSSKPILSNVGAFGPPGSLKIEQDASFASGDGAFVKDRFLRAGIAMPLNYTLQLDGGDLTIPTVAQFDGSNLTLAAPNGQVGIIGSALTTIESLNAIGTFVNVGMA